VRASRLTSRASSCAFTLRPSSSILASNEPSSSPKPTFLGTPSAGAASAGAAPPKSDCTSVDPTGTALQICGRGHGAAGCCGATEVDRPRWPVPRCAPAPPMSPQAAIAASSICCWKPSTILENATPLFARYVARSSSRALPAISSDTRLS
jgi:hypothetical protein